MLMTVLVVMMLMLIMMTMLLVVVVVCSYLSTWDAVRASLTLVLPRPDILWRHATTTLNCRSLTLEKTAMWPSDLLIAYLSFS